MRSDVLVQCLGVSAVFLAGVVAAPVAEEEAIAAAIFERQFTLTSSDGGTPTETGDVPTGTGDFSTGSGVMPTGTGGDLSDYLVMLGSVCSGAQHTGSSGGQHSKGGNGGASLTETGVTPTDTSTSDKIKRQFEHLPKDFLCKFYSSHLAARALNAEDSGNGKKSKHSSTTAKYEKTTGPPTGFKIHPVSTPPTGPSATHTTARAKQTS